MYWVSFRLMGDNLPVKDIQTKLNIIPSHFNIKGDRIGNSLYGKYETNFWVWELPYDSKVSFEIQINNFLDLIESKRDILKEIISLPNVEGDLFLGFSSENGQGGAYFSHKLLKRVSSLNLSISLDLYPPSINEADLENEDTKKEMCCNEMLNQLSYKCSVHSTPFDCPDQLIYRNEKNECGIIVHDGGSSYIRINYCPWCGKG